MNAEYSEQLLACMADVLNQNGFRAELMKKENAPTLLRCEAMRQGKVAKDVVFEICFIPLQLPNPQNGLLQFFVTLFQNAPETNAAQIRKACAYCNDFCALGAFGFFEDAGQLYLKHSTLLTEAPKMEDAVSFVADNISLLLAAVSRFIDGLAAVAFSGMPVDAVIDQELFPKL